jgi:hypothetical protein
MTATKFGKSDARQGRQVAAGSERGNDLEYRLKNLTSFSSANRRRKTKSAFNVAES